MGKATRWLKGLLDKIRPDPTPTSDSPSHRSFPKEKRRWGLVKCSTIKSSNSGIHRVGNSIQTPPASNYEQEDAGKHAIAVAAASAAAADAAVAAAQAAAAVVRLTVSGRCYPPQSPHLSIAGARESWSAIVIQSHFRGYLARRALKALKGLVKLQALVRGHIMRKKTKETMRSIEAMLRAQARARCHRASESPNSSDKSSQIYHHHGPPTPESFEKSSYNNYTNNIQSPMSKGSGSRSVTRVIIHPDKGYINSSGWSESRLNDSKWRSREKNAHHRTTASFSNQEEYYYRPDKILEIDPGKPPRFIKNRGINYFDSSELEFASDQMSQQTTIPSPNINQIKKSIQNIEDDDLAFCTPENSPQFYSVSSRGGASSSSRRQSPMTPTKSDTSGASGMSGYSDCPSYMAYTESSRAKMRSLSVPRQRPQCSEKTSSAKRWSVHQQTVVSNAAAAAAMEACYASKGYVGSGGLDRLGMPVRNNGTGYYSGCLN